jgi:hypothetical protein
MLVYYVLTSCVHTVLYLVDFSATDVSLRGQQLVVGGLRYGHFHLKISHVNVLNILQLRY